MKRFVELINYTLVLFLFFLINLQAKESCKPEFNITKSSKSAEKKESNNGGKNPVFVYFDGSLSMQGYVKDQAGLKNLYVDVVDDLQQISENVGDKTYYHRFGSTIEPIKENAIANVIKPSFYVCKKAVAKCNNQETRIELPFKAAKANKDGTYVIVTDLFLSSKQLVGSTLSSLTKPLKSILKNGKSIGIFGVMSSFNGTIYDIPTREGGTVKYSESQKRPFYIIVIGDQSNINKIRKNLEEQHFIDADDKYKFALITSSPILQNLNVTKKISEKNISSRISRADGFKFEYTDDYLSTYQFNANKKTRINFTIKHSDLIVPGSSGVSNFIIKENLWSAKETKCRKINPEDWRKNKLDKFSNWVKLPGEDFKMNIFKKPSLENMWTGFKYYYYAEIYADKPGNISENDFKEWSVRDSEAQELRDQNPIEFKTLNLTKIIKILNAVANETFERTLVASLALNFNLLK
ncbi:MAG: hypothetical protein CMN79_04345 [Spirochaetales bacterium]|jgi:hypothetical protein|nr:hypothetical protein [Spirochaetales bacterium]|tara:strand:- start:468 stop:1865 length:1398 start_codon:yes stop_codon:yes gene_type:complete